MDAARDQKALPDTVAQSLGISASYDAKGGYASASTHSGTRSASYFATLPRGDYSGTTPPERSFMTPGERNPGIMLKGARL